MNVLEMEYRDEAAPVGWGGSLVAARAPTRPNRQEPTLIDWPDPEPAWKAAVDARLRKLGSYSVGWDGYQGKPPRPSVVAFARNILNSVMRPTTPPPSIVPFSGGGLQLEWHTNGFDIELSIYAPFQAELSVEGGEEGNPIEEMPLLTDFTALGAAVAELA